MSFINEKGDIIGERIKGFYEERNIINSEEIVNAKQKGYGNSFNYDDNLNVYIVKVTKQVNNSFNGYIHLTTPLTEVSEVNQGIVVYSLIGVIFVICTSFILKFFF